MKNVGSALEACVALFGLGGWSHSTIKQQDDWATAACLLYAPELLERTGACRGALDTVRAGVSVCRHRNTLQLPM